MKEAMAPHFGIDAGVGCFCLQERTFARSKIQGGLSDRYGEYTEGTEGGTAE